MARSDSPLEDSTIGFVAQASPMPMDVPTPKSKRARVPLDAAALSAKRKLQVACVVSILFMIAEFVGGFLAGSLAVMTDAAHLLSDVGGFCISLAAIWMQTFPTSAKLSFGFQRAEVIGAMTSVLVIWVLTAVLVYAAVERLKECLQPNPVLRIDGRLMFIVAVIGLVMNVVQMKILGHDHGGHDHSHGGHAHGHDHRHGEAEHDHTHHELTSSGSGHEHGHDHEHEHDNDHEHDHDDLEAGTSTERPHEKKLENLNIEAAFLHVLGDFVQSVGVCIAGGLIWYKPEWEVADPIATFLFSVIVFSTTFGIMKNSIHVLMEGTPKGINADEIERGLCACPSVMTVHDLHIWLLRTGIPSLSAHLISEDPDAALHAAQDYLVSKGIAHTTIQVERPTLLYPSKCDKLMCGQNALERA